MIHQQKKIGFIVTAEYAAKAFLSNHLIRLSHDFTTFLLVNTSNPDFLKDRGVNTTVIPINIQRKVSLITDIHILLKLTILLIKHRPDAFHSITPKAGLIGMAAAWLARVPIRVHTFTGQVWVTKSGMKRFILKRLDWLIANLSTQNIVDGNAQREFLISEGVLTASNSLVFSKGSIAGVELERFKQNSAARSELRTTLGIPKDSTVFLFIGRLNRDKGVIDLATAYKQLNENSSHLIFIGPDEEDLKSAIVSICSNKLQNLHFIDYTDNPQHYMSMSDILCLPSYREGFNNVVIEAAAVGIPAIASNIYGITDSIIHNQTGLLHTPGDVDKIREYMEILIHNNELRSLLANNAYKYITDNFNSTVITDEWDKFYKQKLS